MTKRKTYRFSLANLWSRSRPGDPIQPEKIKAIAESFETLGQRFPISVRKNWDKNDERQWEVIAGRHRHAAAIQLGWTYMDCCIEDGTELDADLWQISENLHRTTMEPRALALATKRWRELRAKRAKVVQVGPSAKTGQKVAPGSVRDTAKSLGIKKTEVIRRNKIASVVPEAAAILEALPPHLKATQADYLEVARHPKAEHVKRARMIESLKTAAHGAAEGNAHKKAGRVLPDQDEAAQAVVIRIRDFVSPVFKQANELAKVCGDLKPLSTQRLARACSDHAQAWIKLAERFGAPGYVRKAPIAREGDGDFPPRAKAPTLISENGIYQEWIRADEGMRFQFANQVGDNLRNLIGDDPVHNPLAAMWERASDQVRKKFVEKYGADISELM